MDAFIILLYFVIEFGKLYFIHIRESVKLLSMYYISANNIK